MCGRESSRLGRSPRRTTSDPQEIQLVPLARQHMDSAVLKSSYHYAETDYGLCIHEDGSLPTLARAFASRLTIANARFPGLSPLLHLKSELSTCRYLSFGRALPGGCCFRSERSDPWHSTRSIADSDEVGMAATAIARNSVMASISRGSETSSGGVSLRLSVKNIQPLSSNQIQAERLDWRGAGTVPTRLPS
jgi:hypothetical protein